MTSRAFRIKILQKLAQTTPTASTTTSTTSQTVPQDTSQKASELYPTLSKGYSVQQLQLINGLVSKLSSNINQLTMGQYNFQKLKNNGFQFDTSSFSDPNAKNLMIFFQQVFKTLLNSGNAFQQPAQPQQVSGWANSLIQSSNLSQLSANGDLVQSIKNTLSEIANNTIKQ